ncbi:hypothetical protein AMECASPLE_037092 [Ameca splendens]|uniref:Uncharacterized protein n=1 Tax=Ameca splendens TaxID=208324 RepID=A0ABV1A409_9TELE
MNSSKYHTGLTENLQVSAKKLRLKGDFIFHRHSDSKHFCIEVSTKPEENEIFGMVDPNPRTKSDRKCVGSPQKGLWTRDVLTIAEIRRTFGKQTEQISNLS